MDELCEVDPGFDESVSATLQYVDSSPSAAHASASPSSTSQEEPLAEPLPQSAKVSAVVVLPVPHKLCLNALHYDEGLAAVIGTTKGRSVVFWRRDPRAASEYAKHSEIKLPSDAHSITSCSQDRTISVGLNDGTLRQFDLSEACFSQQTKQSVLSLFLSQLTFSFLFFLRKPAIDSAG
ncbi:MAG: hypothetical protein Q8P67_27520 [archaeon]|nr:hypothetical protein [archaeon]